MPKRSTTPKLEDALHLATYPQVRNFLAHSWIWPPVSLVCVATGVGLLLVWLEVIPVNEPDRPMWIAGAFGALFLLAGSRVFGLGLGQLRTRARLKRNAEALPMEPWFADYEWDESGSATRLGYSGREHALGVVMSLGVLAPLNWIAFVADGGAVWRYAALTFDAIFAVVVAFQLQTLARRRIHGSPYVEFQEFPTRPGSLFRCRVLYKRDLGEVQKLTATLRFIEERWQKTATADETTVRTVVCERYRDAQSLAPSLAKRLASSGLELEFSIPHDAEGTALNESSPRYWDLEVIAKVRGIDFRHHFLIPVYREV